MLPRFTRVSLLAAVAAVVSCQNLGTANTCNDKDSSRFFLFGSMPWGEEASRVFPTGIQVNTRCFVKSNPGPFAIELKRLGSYWGVSAKLPAKDSRGYISQEFVLQCKDEMIRCIVSADFVPPYEVEGAPVFLNPIDGLSGWWAGSFAIKLSDLKWRKDLSWSLDGSGLQLYSTEYNEIILFSAIYHGGKKDYPKSNSFVPDDIVGKVVFRCETPSGCWDKQCVVRLKD